MEIKVLLIEDNLSLLENTSEILELASYTVLKARNGKEGLALARSHKPDIILCDIMMPELDGFGVLRAINNTRELQRVPFVFVTSKAEKSDRRFGMSLGADDYLTKPFSGEELLSTIETRIRKARLHNAGSGPTALEALLKEDDVANDVTPLLKTFVVKRFSRKERVFTEGTASNFLYYMLNGKIKVFNNSECGREYISRIYKQGDLFGYNALLDEGEHADSAEVLEDAEVGLIPKTDFYTLLENNHELCLRFIHYLSADLSEVKENLVKLAYYSARKKVADAILYIGNKYGADENNKITFPVSRQDISSLSGISPESISRNLTDFREENLIEFRNGMLRILNLPKLQSVKN